LNQFGPNLKRYERNSKTEKEKKKRRKEKKKIEKGPGDTFRPKPENGLRPISSFPNRYPSSHLISLTRGPHQLVHVTVFLLGPKISLEITRAGFPSPSSIRR
jgi:hypothetical protein